MSLVAIVIGRVLFARAPALRNTLFGVCVCALVRIRVVAMAVRLELLQISLRTAFSEHRPESGTMASQPPANSAGIAEFGSTAAFPWAT